MDQAATPTGAEVSARPDTSAQPSVHERLKAHLSAPAETAEPVKPEPAEKAEAPASEEPKVEAKEEAEEKEPVEGAQEEEAEVLPTDFDELAEALGWESDKVLDLEAKVKIDGKDGKVRLRDLVKSHQLEGHLNQKLMAFADEKKAFEAERLTRQREQADKFLKLDAGLQTLQKALAGNFAQVDWENLRATDPAAFNAKYVEYQQHYAQMQDIANQIAAEQKTAQAEAAKQAEAYLAEQKKLFAAKIPEWSDDARRNKDKVEILDYLQSHGITKDEFEQIVDHRQALVIRDAWNWHKLQKSKPAVLKKVTLAPKLLKPGSQQSRASQDTFIAQKERERLRKTGKVSDATALLKRHLFS